jgi:HD-like signal output (HDOD) protein
MNNNILKEIKALPPLPESVIEVNRICSNPEGTIADLAKAIKKDPIATATILKAANSPMYGLKEIKTVENAIAMFGKATTKAFILQMAVKSSFESNLSPYDLSFDDFSNISQKRAFLMTKWYGGIDFHMLNILATSTLLGNIGQIVIAKEILKSDKLVEFKDKILSDENSIEEIEIEYMNTTAIEVTSKILECWKLEKLLVDSLKYSVSLDSLKEADDISYPYALANYAVFKAIDGLGNTNEEELEELLNLLEENNLNSEQFKEIVLLIK